MLFSAGGGGGAGGIFYLAVKISGSSPALGHSPSRQAHVNTVSVLFEPRCLPPHDTNEGSSCDT